MALQLASVAKTASDAAAIQTKPVLTSLIMDVIDTAITAESTRVDLDVRTYKAVLTLKADINGGTKPIDIIQSDDSRVLLEDIEKALIDAKYRVSSNAIKASREEADDKVKLQVAWD